jgi:LPXTG-site transpeptidase (sortase) family protein
MRDTEEPQIPDASNSGNPWGGSADPGLDGNTILVGHNWGYGNKGVFLRIDRLERGQPIQVVNAAGQSFAYQVTAVERVPWRRRDAGELIQHAAFLAQGGPERLTLVTCGGSQVQPFPNRVYVVAEPAG